MKLTFREVIAKISDIDAAIRETEKVSDDYTGLLDASDFLREYRTKILDTVVDI